MTTWLWSILVDISKLIVCILVAIALTLCSIQSALQSPPIECEPWSPYADYQGSFESVGHPKSIWRDTASTPDDLNESHGRHAFPSDDAEGRAMRGRYLESVHRWVIVPRWC